MGTINVTELQRLPCINGEVAPILPAQKMAGKTYTSTTSSQQINAPSGDARFLRVAVIEAHYIAPVAEGSVDTDDILLPAGSVEYIEANRLYYRSVI